MDTKKGFERILQFRHATKRFDSGKKVSKEALRYILEAGRLSPSSFGIEPWQFIVVTSAALKHKVQRACYDQAQVGTASAVIVVAARLDLHLDDGYAEALLRRDGETYYNSFAKSAYSGYTEAMSEQMLGEYADKQCYLASMNLMNAAAALQIDSCPLGGFDEDTLLQILMLDQAKYKIALVVPLGYRSSKPGPRQRRPFDDVVIYADEEQP